MLAILRENLSEWYQDGNSIGRFSAPLNGMYDNASIHGFSIWGRSSKYRDENNTLFSCDAFCAKPFCHDQGGPHWMSGQTAIYGGGGGKKWHPSIGMHMLRGEIIAFNYLGAILDSINMIENDTQVNTNLSMILSKYQTAVNELFSSPSKKPRHCWNEECGYRANCHTNFMPNYNPDALLDRIIVGNHSGWTMRLKYGEGGLNPEYGYLDNKPMYETVTALAQISFRIDIPRNSSLVMVCGSERDSLKHVKFYIEMNVASAGSDYYLHTNKWNQTIHENAKYRGDECFNLWEVSEGKHVLTVINNEQGRRSTVTHVITFQ